MRRMKKLLLILIAVAVIVGVSRISTKEVSSMGTVRISYQRGGACSGVVISKGFVVTAAHCVLEQTQTPYGVFMMPTRQSMLAHSGKIAIPVTIAYISFARDVAVLAGDFSNIPAALNDAGATGINLTDEYLSCGHPMGDRRVICVNLGKLSETDVQMGVFKGLILFGMSGGPVFNNSTGMLVGVNTAIYPRAMGGGSAITPILGLLGELKSAGIIE